MGKLHIHYEDKNALLQINDDSLIITNKDEKIKVTFDSIKDYTYKDKVLTINKSNGNKIILEEVEEDKELFDKLEDYTYIYSSEEEKEDKKEEPQNVNTKSTSPLLIIFIVLGISLLFVGIYIFIDSLGESDNGVPSNIQGTYEYYTENKTGYYRYTIELKSNKAVITSSTTDFYGSKKDSKTYSVKVLDRGSRNADYIEFDLYIDSHREYNCNTNFGVIYCTDSHGTTRNYKKK